VHRVLGESPDPFSTASTEKRAALSHFEPKGALISDLPERVERRRYNEEVLESDNPVHSLAGDLVPKVHEEGRRLLAATVGSSDLEWEPSPTPGSGWCAGWCSARRRATTGA
jgi:hypothetical protein